MQMVSIVIPTYNRAQLLPGAIQSALDQTHPACEVIVVDDGSSDATAQVVSTLGSGVRYLYQANQGVAAACNTGARAAAGEYLLFMGDDDVLEPTAAERLSALMRTAPSVGLVYGQALLVDGQGGTLGIARPSFRRPEGIWPGAQELEHLLCRNYLTAAATLARRSAFLSAGEFDESFGNNGEDWDLWIRLCRRGDVGYLAQPVVRYRVHASSLAHAVTGPMRERALRNWRRSLDGAFGDPVVGPRLQRHRSRVEACFDFSAAELAYVAGDLPAARSLLVRALRRYPPVLYDSHLAESRALWLKAFLPNALVARLKQLRHA